MSNNASADTYEIKASDSDSITEVAVSGLIDSDEDSIRKRSRAYSIESTASDRKVMRGNYRCSRCNKPKKGHKW